MNLDFAALMNSLTQQPPQQQPLWSGIMQNPQQPQPMLPAWQDENARRMAETRRGVIREISPGLTWGGRDSNAIHPDGVMQYRTFQNPVPDEAI
jgi:hypothetical protein